jgi:proprotein convertase subtilisin/kexin type 5
VGACQNGFFPDSTSRQCLPCPANCDSCFSSSFCIICRTGFAAVSGACVQASTCTSSQLTYNGACVATCPQGTYADGTKCSRICADGTYWGSGVCYISCPSGLRVADACVQQCPTGTTNKSGVCA